MFRNIIFLLFVVTTLVTSDALSSSPRPKPKVISSVNELAFQERLALLFLKNTDPRYKNLPDKLLQPSILIEYQDTYTYLDGFLDYAPFLVQSGKWKDSLPEINWRFGISLCFEFWTFCIDQAWSFTSSNSKFLGTDTVSLKTDWTKDSFAWNYTVGNFTWDSPNATILDEDFIDGSIYKCQGAWAKVENLAILITSNITFDDELGIQLEGMKLSFTLGNYSYGYGNCVLKKLDGEETVYEGYLKDDTQLYIDYFEEYDWALAFNVMARMNCLFSDGKYWTPPPDDYEYEDTWEFSCHYDHDLGRSCGQTAALQFLQTIVMGGVYPKNRA